MENKKTRLGIIGGSGVYSMDAITDMRSVSVNTPFGAPSDDIIIGRLYGNDVAFLPRHGRGHRLIPSGINYRANIWAMKKIGVEMLLSVSAVGSMKEEISPGDIVIVDQFFDRTRSRVSTFFDNGLVGHVGFDKPVCRSLASTLSDACARAGVKSFGKGTYICIEGPQFSTYAESCIYRKWSADVIGMTALTEAKLAREAEMCYSSMALVTDYDCWNTGHDSVTADAVVKQMKENVINARKVISEAVPAIYEADTGECSCRNALSGAIMTSPEAVSSEMKEKLQLIAGKYL